MAIVHARAAAVHRPPVPQPRHLRQVADALARILPYLGDTDLVTIRHLRQAGVSAAVLRGWPVVEYADARGRPFWLRTDLEALTEGLDP
jgi:hypothetical protein